MKKRLEALKKDQKGFTLVELIVVLVILAILAALLVPALLGYIDRAKEAKYFEEARSIYTALQVINDERYAKSSAGAAVAKDSATGELTAAEKTEVNNMISPTTLTAVDDITYKSGSTHASFTIDTLKIQFKSQDGTDMKLQMVGGTWEKY